MANRLEVMDLLLFHGANINATTNRGWTPLMLATKRCDETCVSALISRGADVNHQSPDRWTALAEASSKGFTAIMTRLLQAGADTESRSQHDWTPLMHAAYRGDLNAVNLLIEQGASVHNGSARDESPILLAAAVGSAAVVKKLLEAGCDPEPNWSQAILEDSGPIRSDDSAQGILFHQVERLYQVGWTPLMLACQNGSLDVVKLLLVAGANMAPSSPLFQTALEIAQANGRTDVVEYLTQRTEEGEKLKRIPRETVLYPLSNP
jgi:ankyrin repeat protein